MNGSAILLDVIGEVDEELIPEVRDYGKAKKKVSWMRLGAVAAGFLLVSLLGWQYFQAKETAHHKGAENVQAKNASANTSGTSGNGVTGSATDFEIGWGEKGDGADYSQELPEKRIKGSEKLLSAISFGGMGFEGVSAYGPDELENGNPWQSVAGSGVKELPVYRNLAYEGEQKATAGLSSYLTKKQMTEVVQNKATVLGVKVNSVKEDKQDGEVISVTAKCSEDILITAYGNGNVKIAFGGKRLPEEYHFTNQDTTPEEANKVLAYFASEYGELLQYDSPAGYSVTERTRSGEEERYYYLFDRVDDMVRGVLNYHLSFARFMPDDTGKLYGIMIYSYLDHAEYLGDYSIITVSEATELLLDGRYYSSVPEEYLQDGKVREEDVAKAELVYRPGMAEFYQPYYRFYVELDAGKFQLAEGLKNYGIFYVPAVNALYLEDAP